MTRHLVTLKRAGVSTRAGTSFSVEGGRRAGTDRLAREAFTMLTFASKSTETGGLMGRPVAGSNGSVAEFSRGRWSTGFWLDRRVEVDTVVDAVCS